MTTTFTGALIAYLAPLEPTVAVYRDRAPEQGPTATLGPYLVVREGITSTNEATGDTGSATADVNVADEVQLDLYLPHHDDDTRAIAEDWALPDRLRKHLTRATFATAVPRIVGFTVLNASRMPDLDENVVRTMYRCRVHRQL